MSGNEKNSRLKKLQKLNAKDVSGAQSKLSKPSSNNDVRFTFKLVTPAVIGGSDNKHGNAELRVSSIMGAIRFWWRALAWHRASMLYSDPAKRLELVQDWQQSLFGGGGDADDPPSKLFTARLENIQNLKSRKCVPPRGGYPNARFGGWRGSPDKTGMGLGYLAGQGFMVKSRNRPETNYERDAIEPGCSFDLVLKIRPEAPLGGKPSLLASKGRSPAERDLVFKATKNSGSPSLPDAIHVMNLLGGVGARSRRGFGAIQLLSVSPADTGIVPIRSCKEHFQALYKLGESLRGAKVKASEIPYTALSSLSEFIVAPQGGPSTMHDFHNYAGLDFILFRSNGNRTHGSGARRSRTINEEKLEPFNGQPTRFWDDHEFFYRVHTGKHSGEKLPERAAFGLPHNYFSPADRERNVPAKSLNLPSPGADPTRRASALFLTLREYSDGPVAIWSALYARYLNESHVLARNGGKQVLSLDVRNDEVVWAPIREFMQKLRKTPVNGDFIGPSP